MRKLNKKTVFGAAAAVVCVAVALVFLLRPKHVEEILPIVGVDTVRTRNVEVYGEFPGKIRAQQFVEVRARVEGYLEKMMFAEGTRVNKDQVLFIIDPKQYKAQVDRAEALVAKNKAIALKAERDLARIKPLFEQKAVKMSIAASVASAYYEFVGLDRKMAIVTNTGDQARVRKAGEAQGLRRRFLHMSNPVSNMKRMSCRPSERCMKPMSASSPRVPIPMRNP